MRFIFYVFIFCVFTVSNIFAQNTAEDLKSVLRLQDERSLGANNELLEFLNSDEDTVVISAIYALSNISDSTTTDAISVQLKNHKSPDVRKWAAFALGQIGTDAAPSNLMEAMESESNSDVLAEIIEAIGKTGSESDLDKLPKIKLNDEKVQSALVMAVARFALRNIKNQNSIRILDALYAYGEAGEVGKSIAYALWRIRDGELLKPERQKILNFLKFTDPETRSYAVYALNAIKEPGDVPLLVDMLKAETDWRVKVNILNTLGNFTLDSVKQYQDMIEGAFAETVTDPSDYVKITAADNTGKLFSQFNFSGQGDKPVKIPGTSYLMSIIGSGGWYSYNVRAAALNAYARIMKDNSKGVLFEEFYHSPSIVMDEAIINGFQYFENGDIVGELRDSISSLVMRYNEQYPNTTGEMIPSPFLGKIYRAYVETLGALLPKMKSEESLNLARLSFIEFADSRKPDIVFYSLQGLQSEEMMKREDWLFENKEVLNFEYAGFEYPKDVDVMTLFAETFGELKDTVMLDELRKNLNRDSYDLAVASAGAIEKITGEKIEVDPGKFPKHTDFDWDYLSSAEKVTVIMKTQEGEIELEMYPNVAPFTVMNFLKLAEKDYFDSTRFHRVIANFVIQGGDPTGTGFGGPGYSIRGEYSPLPYERGTLGMASAGKDTEGSQFFITHSRTPHLDGKYTIFGKVTRGIDVVDRIQQDDLLIDVTIIRN